MQNSDEYRIYGKVIDRETRRGIPNLMIKAYDKDHFIDDLLGSAITKSDGSFEITYEEGDFKELIFDKKPDIYLIVMNPNGKVIHSTRRSIRYNADKIEEYIIKIRGDLEGRGSTDGIFKIRGKLKNSLTGATLVGYSIKAYDKDIFFDDKLGDSITDEEGSFKIEFSEKDFREFFFDRTPEVYLKIYHPDGSLVHTTEDDPPFETGDDEKEIGISIWKKEIGDWWRNRMREKKLNGEYVPYPSDFHPFLKCEEDENNPLYAQINAIPRDREDDHHEGEISFIVENTGNCPAYTCYVEVYEGVKGLELKFSNYMLRGRVRVELQPAQKKTVKVPWKREQISGYLFGTCFDPILDPRLHDEFQVGQRNIVFSSFTIRED